MAIAESAAKPYSRISPERYADEDELLDAVRYLYRRHGIMALSTPFLEKQRFNLYQCLLAAGLKQPALLKRLGLTEKYAAWRNAHRTYRGLSKPTWSWEVAVAKAKELVSERGDLPTVEWCRQNGLASLTSAVHKDGKKWEDLRVAVGLRPSRNFCESSNGMRWLSQPEALLSDFLHARGIEHKCGERYPTDYAKKSGRKWGRYDLHFRAMDGAWIDVEVWGDSLSRMSGDRYNRTRALKETYQDDRPDFLGISHKDCYAPKRLAKIMERFIGRLQQGATSKPNIGDSERTRFAGKDEVLAACRALAAQMPDGVFPSDSWLRKRGKHANRPGEKYDCLATNVSRWCRGTRQVRKLLGQDSASTTKWTLETMCEAWDEFTTRTGLTPSQCKGTKRCASVPPEVAAEASKIYEAARRNGWLAAVRMGRSARRTIWTTEHTGSQWRAFLLRHGKTPSQCMSKIRRHTMPRAVTDEATRIYDAARRLRMLDALRRESFRQ